jgi:hypothetical protein
MSLNYSTGQIPKIGDTVSVIDKPKVSTAYSSYYRRTGGKGYNGIKAGVKYEVIDIISSSKNCLIKIKGCNSAMKSSNFQLIEDSNIPAVVAGVVHNVVVMNDSTNKCIPFHSIDDAKTYIIAEMGRDFKNTFSVFEKTAAVYTPKQPIVWRYDVKETE